MNIRGRFRLFFWSYSARFSLREDPDDLLKRVAQSLDLRMRTLRFLWREERMREGSWRSPGILMAGRCWSEGSAHAALVTPLLNSYKTPVSRLYNSVRPYLRIEWDSTKPTTLSVHAYIRRAGRAALEVALAIALAGLACSVGGALARSYPLLGFGLVVLAIGVAQLGVLFAVIPETIPGQRALDDWFAMVAGQPLRL